VFVSPAERYGLENFSSHWCAVVWVPKLFEKGKQKKIFDDVKWMLT
jgi:hypothetical protein